MPFRYPLEFKAKIYSIYKAAPTEHNISRLAREYDINIKTIRKFVNDGEKSEFEQLYRQMNEGKEISDEEIIKLAKMKFIEAIEKDEAWAIKCALSGELKERFDKKPAKTEDKEKIGDIVNYDN